MTIGRANNRNHKQPRERISTTLTPGEKRALDSYCATHEESRSDVVAEAIREYLAARADEDRERATRLEQLEAQLGKDVERLAAMISDNQITAEVMYQALLYQFPALEQADPEELRQRAIAARRRKRRS